MLSFYDNYGSSSAVGAPAARHRMLTTRRHQRSSVQLWINGYIINFDKLIFTYLYILSLVLHYYGAMDRFVVKKITAENDRNIEKCTKIQNKSIYYSFLIFIILY